MDDVYVHEHALKYGLDEDEIIYAWTNFVRSQQRRTPREDQIVRTGYGKKTARSIQMIGVAASYGTLIIHAMNPVQDSIRRELGLPRR
ncbi:hypothetical protein [Raoultibacter phocaeensis]|uniref:hypothetical protein n=1 Tax=Raoultibacter phocaeensis TaxID=2479841 RepID=UPI00111BC70C|nr:hypothetical protein [Raoultibacter phocaeensis]